MCCCTRHFPLFLAGGAGIVAQVVGTSLLGHQATARLAAFALVSAVLTPVSAAVSGGLRGMSPFVATCRDRPDEALALLKDARWLSLGLGAAGAGVVLCVPVIARIGGAPREVIAEFGALPLLFALHVLLSAVGGGANGALVALGRSRLVLRSSLPSTAVEVVLLLVLAPSMGVEGVGVALVTSTALALTVSNTLLLWQCGGSGWSPRPRPREILRMAKVGLPMSATLVVKFTALGAVTYAAARTGAHGAAAHAVLMSLHGIVGLASLATGQALTPEIARAATPREARRLARAALTIVTGAALAGGLVLLRFGEEVFRLFTSDAEVLASAVALVPLFAVHTVAGNCGVVLGSALMGLRRSSWNLATAVVGYGLLALVMTPMATTWGMAGLWTALTVASVLILTAQAVIFVRNVRLSASVAGGQVT